MSIKKVFFVFLFMKVMSGRLKGIVLSVSMQYSTVQLEIFILQYIGWCVLIIWTFIVNQFIIIIIIIVARASEASGCVLFAPALCV